MRAGSEEMTGGWPQWRGWAERASKEHGEQ